MILRRIRLGIFYLVALLIGATIIESDIITGHHTNISSITRAAEWEDKPKELLGEPSVT